MGTGELAVFTDAEGVPTIETTMEQRKLTGTNLTVSRVCFGTMTFGGQTDRSEAKRIIDLCLDRGINFYDTANVYTDGASERILGEILGGRRKDLVVASKVGMKVGEQPPGLTAAAIAQAVEGSLCRLKTDYLDLYYMHLPDHGVPIEESLEAMDKLVRQGKVRYIAGSNFAGWQLSQMHRIAERDGYQAPRIAQPMYNLLARRIEDEFLPACRELGISTIVYNPLAGGLLTGKQTAGKPLPGTRFEGNKGYLDRYWHQTNFDAIERLKEIADAVGRSLVSLALNWLLHHRAIDGVILGASKVEHLEQNLSALNDGALRPDTLAACDQVWQMINGPAPKYNR